MSSPIFVAIDTPDMDRARAIAAAVKRHAGGLKLGLEFFSATTAGRAYSNWPNSLPIFLDLKLHDIPNTVAKAVQALAPITPAVSPSTPRADGPCWRTPRPRRQPVPRW
jgi:orotidine-5'-phosphate decarboxylase